MDPVDSLIATLFIGIGTVLLYGAYRNRRVFGAEGIIPQALSKGSITDLSTVPEAFEGFGSGGVAGAVLPKESGQSSKLEHALDVIKTGDRSLGEAIESRAYSVYEGMPRTELVPLAQLLILAEVKGFRDSVATIRNHVLGVTGERI